MRGTVGPQEWASSLDSESIPTPITISLAMSIDLLELRHGNTVSQE